MQTHSATCDLPPPRQLLPPPAMLLCVHCAEEAYNTMLGDNFNYQEHDGNTLHELLAGELHW